MSQMLTYLMGDVHIFSETRMHAVVSKVSLVPCVM